MRARLVFHEKRLVWSASKGKAGVAEIKVWEVPVSTAYPAGRKFSLFFVVDGEVLVGIDNHKPKGPHLHLGEKEQPLIIANEKTFVDEFWALVEREGYQP